MEDQSFKNRVASITEAVRRASPLDASTGIPRTASGDQLDQLVDAIDGLLQRSQKSASAFRKAQEVLLKPDAPGDQALRFQGLMEALEKNIPDTIYFKDTLGRFIHVSKAHMRAFNLIDGKTAIGKTDFDFFTEEHAREAFEDEQKIIRTGQPIINKEEKETWPDHPPTWVLTTKMPLRDAQGNIIGTFGISHDITERKRAEEELKKSEERYRMLFNSINDAAFVHELIPGGESSRITEVNDTACEWLGLAREEFLGKDPFQFISAEAGKDARDMLARLQEQEHAVWEGTLRGNAGRAVPVETSNHLFDLEGKPTILSTARDITTRKQLEETLAKEKALLLTLINTVPDYISIKDPESRVIITNTANAVVMGLERAEDAIGKRDTDVYPPAEAARYLADEQVIFQTGASLFNKEEESRDRKGHPRWTLTTKVPVKDPSGKIVGVVCAGRDITERKHDEQRIQDLARFPDENPNPVIRVSLDGSVMYSNQSGRSFMPSWSGTHAGHVPPEHLPLISKAWESGEKTVVDVREGKSTFSVAITPIRSRGYVNLYARDVTEERSLAQKFLQAQKMEAVGRLAGGIAHDFNNLLTVIGGYCDLLKDHLPPQTPEGAQVAEIARAARQASTLTRQLLAFSRKQFLMPQVIDPNELLASLENILVRLVGEDIEVKSFLNPDTGNITADPGQIEQVLMNLVVNSRDAMPHGGKLTIETSSRTLGKDYAQENPGLAPGEYVRIAVSDTGHGMDREVLAHIFEPFFTTKEQGKGTGLGLSTVYGIVKQSGGYITCYSEPGKGTTFTIYFPRSYEASTQSSAHFAPSPALGGTETILLVEDEETVRQFMHTVLESNGYTVLAASGGREAQAVIESLDCKVGLVVTDVVMPQMNGKELVLRLQNACPGLKALFISGYTGNAIEHHGMLDTGIDFMQKPFTSQELLGKIREILGRSQG